MTRVYRFLLSLLAAVGFALAMYLKGRNAGKKVEQTKTLQAEVEREKAANETLTKAVAVQSDVASSSDADVNERLRSKYQRD